MKRKLFTLLAAISLLLCVASVALFICSHQTRRMIKIVEVPNKAGPEVISIRDGQFVFSYPGAYAGGVGGTPPVHRFAIPGFKYAERAGFWQYDCHLGWPIAIAAVFPVAWMWRCLKPKVMVLENTCHSCGYDLRATPQRCPECGAVPQRTP